jgi:hypothetical protein
LRPATRSRTALVAGAADQGRRFLVDDGVPGPPEVLPPGLFQGQPELLGDERRAADQRDVGQRRLALVAESRRLDRAGLDDAPHGVEDERGQHVVVHVLRDDEERGACLHGRFQHRDEHLRRRQPLLAHEHEGLVEHDGLALDLVDEVRRQEAAVELQALDDLELGGDAGAVLDRDGPLPADPGDRLGDDVADGGVVVGGDGGDVRDLRVVDAGLRHLLERRHDGLHAPLDAALELHRVHAGGEILQALDDHRVRDDGRCRRAVARHLAGAGRGLAQQPGAHVLEVVLELDGLGHDHARVDDARRPEGLLEEHRAPARAQRDLDGVGQHVNAALDLPAGVLVEQQLLGGHGVSSVAATLGISSWARVEPAQGRRMRLRPICGPGPRLE